RSLPRVGGQALSQEREDEDILLDHRSGSGVQREDHRVRGEEHGSETGPPGEDESSEADRRGGVSETRSSAPGRSGRVGILETVWWTGPVRTHPRGWIGAVDGG